MKNIQVKINKAEPVSDQRGLLNGLAIAIFIPFAVIILILLLLFLVISYPFRKISQLFIKKVINDWHEIYSDNFITIERLQVPDKDIPLNLNKLGNIYLYRSNPQLPIFNNIYFTDLMLTASGSFIFQVIDCDNETGEMLSMPICLLDTIAKEVQEIKDLKDYEVDQIYDEETRFIISANGKGDTIEIIIDK